MYAGLPTLMPQSLCDLPAIQNLEGNSLLSPTSEGVEALTTGAAVGIAVITTAVVFFMAGIVTGILVYCCTSK